MKQKSRLYLPLIALSAAITFASCTVKLVEVTNNPVGTEVVKQRNSNFKPVNDLTLSGTAKKANLQNIGVIELTYGMFSSETKISGTPDPNAPVEKKKSKRKK